MIETILISKKDISIMDMASIVRKINFFDCDLRFTKGEKTIRANEILNINELDIKSGDEIKIRILGRKLDQEDEIFAHVKSVFDGKRNHEE